MKIYIERHGCSLNHGEADLLGRMALERGWEPTGSAEDADLLVLTTCVVVQGTEAKLLDRVRKLSATGKPLVVYGCMVNVMAERVRGMAPAARLLTTKELKDFPSLLEKAGPPRTDPGTEVHANIPISNGCRGQCTYCIARLARGELRSRPFDDILGQVRASVAQGRTELRLTAQDTALYGQDLRDKADLPSLLREITSIDGRFMVRVGMMNPDSTLPVLRHLLWAFLDPKVYKFLHVPVQSGSDQVLARMGRGYHVEDFIEVVQRFREAIPELYLSTDIIAGFPGETDADHRATMDLLEAVRPDVVNLKAFSARPGTEAKAMPGRVLTSVVKSRTKELHDLKKKISSENLAVQKGRELDVLLTERPKPGSTMGRSMEYRPIVIKAEAPLGSLVRVKVEGRKGDYLLGTQI